MARLLRTSVGGICYHVMNRGNGRSEVFHKDGDYEAFLGLIGTSWARLPMRVLAYCLMPNHFHLALQPFEDGDLSQWMQWLTTAHVRRYHKHYGSSGHVWQDRFKSFPVQSDEHLYIVLRYIERNPLRANLAEHAQEWPWSSLQWWRRSHCPAFLHSGPLERPADWVRRVNRPETDAELAALRESVGRGSPFGAHAWRIRTAARFGLESTLRPRGRPRKGPKK